MVRIAVVDDDPEFRNKLVEYVDRFYDNDEMRYRVSCYGNGLDFLEEFKCNYDIALLDIQMPKISGMDIADEIRKSDSEIVIMFITQTSSFAIRGYGVDALDYILKPLDYDSFAYKFARAVKAAANKRHGKEFLLNDDSGAVVRINTDDLVYVAKEKDDAVFYTADGVYRKRIPLFKVEELLDGAPAAVANSGCLVNLTFVKNIKDNAIYLTNGQTVPLSRGKKKEFYSAFFDYVNKFGARGGGE